MRSLLLALWALSLTAQDAVRVVHIADADAAALAGAWQRKQAAEREWQAASQRVYEKYVTTPALAMAGAQHLDVRSILGGWEYGMDFSLDFAVAVPKLAPDKLPTCAFGPETHSVEHVNTIPEVPFLK